MSRVCMTKGTLILALTTILASACLSPSHPFVSCCRDQIPISHPVLSYLILSYTYLPHTPSIIILLRTVSCNIPYRS